MKSKISDKDKKDWEDFINNNEKLPSKDVKNFEINTQFTRSIDLHGSTLEEANKIIQNFISKAYKDKVSKLIVVTGKGIHSNKEADPYVSKDLSILKHSVPEFIKKNENLMNLILEIKDAKIEDGGSGAFYIYPKKIKK